METVQWKSGLSVQRLRLPYYQTLLPVSIPLTYPCVLIGDSLHPSSESIYAWFTEYFSFRNNIIKAIKENLSRQSYELYTGIYF